MQYPAYTKKQASRARLITCYNDKELSIDWQQPFTRILDWSYRHCQLFAKSTPYQKLEK